MRFAVIAALFAVTAPACGTNGNGQPDSATDTNVGDVDASADVPVDTAPAVGPMGGTVNLLHFAAFGDVRPPNVDDTVNYPVMAFASVITGIQSLGAQFAMSSGDYVYADEMTDAQAQVDRLLAGEAMFSGTVFHSLGNHDCDTTTLGNCPLEDETANITQFRTRLTASYANSWYDFVVHTSMGDAHFIVTAPNAWGPAQQSFITAALAMPTMYTFVVAHEPPTDPGPGTTEIESAVAMRTGGVTLRLYGHDHLYRHVGANEVVSGNAGAPLDSSRQTFGWVMVDQLADGTIQVSAYQIGTPPMLTDMWSVHADGTAAP